MFRKYYWLLPLFFLALIAFFSFNNSAVAQGPMGGPGAADQKLVEKFDLDKKGYLNSEERKTARSFLETEQKNSNRRRRRRGRAREAGKPGPKVSPNDVKNFPELSLYDPKAFRTLFLEFEDDDWEKQLEIFKATDIEIPAIMKVDGKDYPNVGVSFRGASSFFMIPEGLKRSLNLSIDFIDNKQRMYDYKSLNLLNCNGDPTMMSSALYSYLCSQKIPTPKVNFVKVVINGESWGVYVSSQQFNKVFAKENFGESSGARWKVSGSPRGDGGLRYLGTDVAEYKKRFDIKSKDKQESWNDLINLCEVLNETPLEKLQAELEPILDIDGLLWFLAVDVVTANSDGYWTRASDFSIYQDSKGKFHILPHDMNEAFQVRHGRGGPGGGPRRGPPGFGPPPQRGGGERGGGERGGGERGGGERGGGERGARGGQRGGPGGGAGGGGIHLDPLIGLGNDRMPLRSRLLNVPELRVRYLENVRTLAEILRWETIGPKVKEMRDLIQDEVEKDTRKLSSTEDFIRATSDDTPGEGSNSLRSFAEQRAKFLLDHPKIKALTESENKK